MYFLGLRGLAETQGRQRSERGSSVCGSQWMSRPDKIQEHQSKMAKTTPSRNLVYTSHTSSKLCSLFKNRTLHIVKRVLKSTYK